MILVINEWIFHDLLFDNGADRFRSTAKFVVNLDNSDDRIVMPTEERWRRKAFQLMTAHSPAQRQVSQLFHSLLRNTDRCIRLLPSDIPGNPQDPYDWAPPEDVYLIESCVASGADLLVTTDEELFDKVKEHSDISCQMRDDFLATYETAR